MMLLSYYLLQSIPVSLLFIHIINNEDKWFADLEIANKEQYKNIVELVLFILGLPGIAVMCILEWINSR